MAWLRASCLGLSEGAFEGVEAIALNVPAQEPTRPRCGGNALVGVARVAARAAEIEIC